MALLTWTSVVSCLSSSNHETTAAFNWDALIMKVLRYHIIPEVMGQAVSGGASTIRLSDIIHTIWHAHSHSIQLLSQADLATQTRPESSGKHNFKQMGTK